MIRHIFLDKTNTIIENSYQNLGINPILSVGYGEFLMRGLIHFSLDEIRSLINDKTFANVDKLSFKLKMTNCFSVDSVPYEKPIAMSPGFLFKRASSFDLMLFKIPTPFDGGRGFDYADDLYIKNRLSYSTEGSNWYFAKTCVPWKYEVDKFNLNDMNLNLKKVRYYDRKKSDEISYEIMQIAERYYSEQTDIETVKADLIEIAKDNSLNSKALKGGLYPNDYIRAEYEKYLNCEESIIIGTQHFDFGSENLEIDITQYVFDELSKEYEENYGICLAFTPYYESIGDDFEQYVGFFNDNTNTFFHPYIEVFYDDYVLDDRESITIGKNNNLCLYAYDDGNPVNLDQIPTCIVNGNEADVRQVTKGIYCANFYCSEDEMEPASIYVDEWKNISVNGKPHNDIELEFSTRPSCHKLMIGDVSNVKNQLVPALYGINDNEQLKRFQERIVIVDFREKFSTDKRKLTSNGEYRIYVYDGNRQLDVIPYTKIEKGFLNNYFKIYTEDFIPNKYYIDIKINDGNEVRFFENVLSFEIVSDVTERYE